MFDAVWAGRQRHMPEPRFVNRHHDDPGYIDALARASRRTGACNGQPDQLVMSFHGVPERTLHLGDPYHCELPQDSPPAGRTPGPRKDRWQLTFQSRFGKAKWLSPTPNPPSGKMAQSGAGGCGVPGLYQRLPGKRWKKSARGSARSLPACGRQGVSLHPRLNDSPEWIAA